MANLSLGERLPPFELPDEEGLTYDLRERLEEGPAALVFYRGVW